MASNQLMARISGCHSYEFNVCRLESKWRLCRPLNQDLQQFIRVCFNGPTNLDEFDDVDTPFATFVFAADEGVWRVHAGSGRQFCVPRSSNRKTRLALPNGRICRVCALE